MKLLAVLTTLALAITPALAQHRSPEPPMQQHHTFDDPQRWSKMFDDPERDAWQKPDDVIRALELKPDARVADIGAGTGYFAMRFARAIPNGIVFAADLEPKMVEHLTHRAKKEELANIRSVQAGADSARLPEPVDVIVVVNTYHHIDKRADYFRQLKGSLRPNGRIAIIDYKLDAPDGPPQQMRIGQEDIVAEMKAAGYALSRSHAILPHQNFLVFTPL